MVYWQIWLISIAIHAYPDLYSEIISVLELFLKGTCVGLDEEVS